MRSVTRGRAWLPDHMAALIIGRLTDGRYARRTYGRLVDLPDAILCAAARAWAKTRRRGHGRETLANTGRRREQAAKFTGEWRPFGVPDGSKPVSRTLLVTVRQKNSLAGPRSHWRRVKWTRAFRWAVGSSLRTVCQRSSLARRCGDVTGAVLSCPLYNLWNSI